MVEKTAGVVLAGGRSSRMGSPKAALDWHGSTLLRRTVSVVARAVTGPVIVVRAPGQQLPDLPPEVEVAADPREGLGPLQGIAVGLAALSRPGRGRLRLLHRPALPAPGLHRRRARRADPGAGRGAAGRPRLSPAAGRRLPHQPRSGGGLARRRRPPPPRLPLRPVPGASASTTPPCGPTRPSRRWTPSWTRWSTSTSPQEYEQARRRPPPEVTVQCFGAVANRAGAGPRTVRAATLAQAAAAVSVLAGPPRRRCAQRGADHQGRPPAARHRRHGGVPLGGRRGVSAVPGGYFGRALVVAAGRRQLLGARAARAGAACLPRRLRARHVADAPPRARRAWTRCRPRPPWRSSSPRWWARRSPPARSSPSWPSRRSPGCSTTPSPPATSPSRAS